MLVGLKNCCLLCGVGRRTQGVLGNSTLSAFLNPRKRRKPLPFYHGGASPHFIESLGFSYWMSLVGSSDAERTQERKNVFSVSRHVCASVSP